MKKFLVLATLLLTSCAHQVKSADDLQINDSYPMINAEDERIRICTLQAQNVATMVTTPAGLLPMAALGETSAYVCGKIDCSTSEDEKLKKGSPWSCAAIEVLMEPLPPPEDK